jgi:DNA-binding IclR family transcriptional regulator
MSHRAAAVASKAIEYALRDESFTVSDIRGEITDAPSRTTVYRVLDELATDDWIQQRGNGWQPGMKPTTLGVTGDDDNVIDLDAGDLLT